MVIAVGTYASLNWDGAAGGENCGSDAGQHGRYYGLDAHNVDIFKGEFSCRASQLYGS